MIGTPFLRLNACKAMVGAISPRCRIEQTREGYTWTQSGQFLLGERFVSPTKRHFFVGETNLSLRRYCPLWVKTLTDLLNPTSGRDTSHLQLISARPKWRCTTHVVHPFLRFYFCIFTLQNGTVWIVLGLLLVFTKMVLFFDDLAKIKYISMHMCHLTAKTNHGE